MKKPVIFSIVGVFLLLGIGSVLWLGQKSPQGKILKNELQTLSGAENIPSAENSSEENGEKRDEKIENLRKRFSLRGTIARGDNFVESNQPLLAMGEYLKALRQNPDDEQILKKLGNVYFELKKFDKAQETFSKTKKSLTPEEKEKYILSIVYTIDTKSDADLKNKKDLINGLDILNLEEKFYYINTINCSINFHECKKRYQNYFTEHQELSFDRLKNIKNAFNNFDNFKTESIYYKDALLIGAIYQNKMYPIGIATGQSLLQSKPDYRPIILLIGKGYYDLGQLTNAKFWLEKYYKLDETNLDITYLLGNINFKLKDYYTSNLYYNSALKGGYKYKVDLQRKLAYNYYLLSDYRSMINIFGYLVEEKESNIDDYSLAIYHAILQGRTINAEKWSQMGIERFKNTPGNEIFYGYLGWMRREQKNIEEADKYLKEGLKINPRNSLLTLNMGYLEEVRQNYSLAEIYFKRTISMNGDGEFGELAQKELQQIEKLKAQSGGLLQNTGSIQ